MRPNLLKDDLECVIARLPCGKDELAKTDSGVEAGEGCRVQSSDRGWIPTEIGVSGIEAVAGEVLDGCSAT
jgi:hypothetical protein